MKTSLALIAILLIPISAVRAGQTKTAGAAAEPSVQEIIRRFATAESQNKTARSNYTFTQDFDIKTIGIGGQVSGEMHRVSDIVLDNHGNRFEKITYSPSSTLTELSITPEDMQDLAGVQPF